ncbi:hypothetical protein CF98_14495 [Halopseudomonas bauzanensis]|nr:hypothetical protein CF98_14495 [Halopseudomonas bauzanensis]
MKLRIRAAARRAAEALPERFPDYEQVRGHRKAGFRLASTGVLEKNAGLRLPQMFAEAGCPVRNRAADIHRSPRSPG